MSRRRCCSCTAMNASTHGCVSRCPRSEFRPTVVHRVPRCCRRLAGHQAGLRHPLPSSRGPHASCSASQVDAAATTKFNQDPVLSEPATIGPISSTPSSTSEQANGASSSGSHAHLPGASHDHGSEALPPAPDNSISTQQAQQEPSPSTSTPAEISRTLISYYRWPRQRSPKYRPMFLDEFAPPSDTVPNLISFLGARDCLGGKYFVSRESYPAFLNDYLAAFQTGYAMFMAERYLRDPYRYFIELDFMWDIDLEVVEAVTNSVIDLVISSVEKLYSCRMPRCLVSMRTPYKVHLNFPDVITTEPLAYKCRDMVVALCQERLSAEFPLDWERIVDFPHGSLRLLGSIKTRYMDSDPAWVRDKAYYPVAWSEEERRWTPRGIHFRLLCDSSIQPTLAQLQAFESSSLFRDMAYDDIESYHRKLEERRKRRAERAGKENERSDPIKVKLQAQDDGYVRVRVVRRQWARADMELKAVMEQIGLIPPPRLPRTESERSGQDTATDAASAGPEAEAGMVDDQPSTSQQAAV